MEVESCMADRTVKMYKAGKKTIIEIEEADDNLDQAIFYMIAAYTGQRVEKEILDLEPVNSKTEETLEKNSFGTAMIMKGGCYGGMTARQALGKYGEQALANLYEYVKYLNDEEEKAAICKVCKQYMATVLKQKKETVTDKKEIERILRILSPLVDSTKLAKMFSYRNLDDFLKYAEDEEKRLAFRGMMEHLIQRGSQ